MATTNDLPECVSHLADQHKGMKISARGILGRIRDGKYFAELNIGCGEMLRHLEEMAERFYAGDIRVVDEFLQMYCLDEHRPQTAGDLEGGAS